MTEILALYVPAALADSPIDDVATAAPFPPKAAPVPGEKISPTPLPEMEAVPTNAALPLIVKETGVVTLTGTFTEKSLGKLKSAAGPPSTLTGRLTLCITVLEAPIPDAATKDTE